jgi:hypothetical protein
MNPSLEATSRSTTQEYPIFYETQIFITKFTRASRWSLP